MSRPSDFYSLEALRKSNALKTAVAVEVKKFLDERDIAAPEQAADRKRSGGFILWLYSDIYDEKLFGKKTDFMGQQSNKLVTTLNADEILDLIAQARRIVPESAHRPGNGAVGAGEKRTARPS